ncbi:hypothetical protein QFZ83_003702 [Variovorax sp. W1I1]|uniref:hypothetical protein n=1 Tax=Variovorax sp. W1I1 TaxID=3042309 RepID=UPI00278A17E1|nr:hypothetical protein [Variovorax sp. W1I1]MDQ0609531.1 hypothetical protein [Variovorax sp. W1I1]
MASVVDTSVKHFGSFMGASAPVLNGVAGSLNALIYACAVTGFDAITLTSLEVSGGIATATYTGSHSSAIDTVVLISGVTGALVALNGEQKIVAKPSAGVVRFATAAADGIAAGTITMKIAPLGWLRTFAVGNVASFKSADPASTGMSLRIDDSAATIARVVGYESMSDVNTGLGRFPTDVQVPGGGVWPKSNVASAAAVPWFVVGDGRAFYLWVAPYAVTVPACNSGWVRGFGDMVLLRASGDAYACALNYSNQTAVTAGYDGVYGGYGSSVSARTACPRSFTGLGSSVVNYVYPYTGAANAVSGCDSTLGGFPSKVDGQLKFSSLYITEFPEPRAEVPGLYSVPQTFVYDTFKHLDPAPGTGLLAGRKLLSLQIANSGITSTPTSGNSGGLFVDVTGPWAR